MAVMQRNVPPRSLLRPVAGMKRARHHDVDAFEEAAGGQAAVAAVGDCDGATTIPAVESAADGGSGSVGGCKDGAAAVPTIPSAVVGMAAVVMVDLKVGVMAVVALVVGVEGVMVVQAEKDHARHHCHCHPQTESFFEVAARAKQLEDGEAAVAVAGDEQAFHCCSLLLVEGRPRGAA